MKPKSQLTDPERKIGHFMIAIGAIIEDETTGNILVVKRTDDFHKNTWEIIYGRIDQFEDLDVALFREVKEETGLTDIKIQRLTRIWHLYRGEKTADKEVYGLTFYCTTSKPQVKLSDEHSEYRWVTPQEAIELCEVKGIKTDIQFFRDNKTNGKLGICDQESTMKYIFN